MKYKCLHVRPEYHTKKLLVKTYFQSLKIYILYKM